MDECEQHFEACWQPGPTLALSRLYHPALSPDHPAFDMLSFRRQVLVKALHRQYERWDHKPYFKKGLSGRLIAALNGYRFAAKLAGCMMCRSRYSKNRLERCNLDWFCVFCAYLKGQDLLKKYANSWEENSWFEMVLSLENGLCPGDFGCDFIADVMDAMEAVVKRLQNANIMRGYVAWLEIKVHQFYPHVVCTPHIHVLLRGDCCPDRDACARVIASEWCERKLISNPDLFLEPVKSAAHFFEILCYVKPIDLQEPYERGYRAARREGRVELLHRDVREFFDALTIETTIYQGGTLEDALLKALREYLPKPLWRIVRKEMPDRLLKRIAKARSIDRYTPLSALLAEILPKVIEGIIKRSLVELEMNAIPQAIGKFERRRLTNEKIPPKKRGIQVHSRGVPFHLATCRDCRLRVRCSRSFDFIFPESESMIMLWPNHALQRTRLERRGCNHSVPRAGSLSLGVRPPRVMSLSTTIDTSKSLAELTGIVWGVAPADAGTLIRERHEIRRAPIRDLPHTAIVHFLDMGSDADILVPVALERLREDPDAVGLLCAVLRAEHFDWRSQPELVAVMRDRVYTVASKIGQITSDLERLQYEAAVWRLYAEFERGLSAV